MEENIRLIQCGDHSFAPWSIMCVHVMEHTAEKAVAVDKDDPLDENEYDWICPDCYKECFLRDEDDEVPLDNLRAVCMHCAKGVMAYYRPEDILMPEDGEESWD
jgi:hypothetical protein